MSNSQIANTVGNIVMNEAKNSGANNEQAKAVAGAAVNAVVNGASVDQTVVAAANMAVATNSPPAVAANVSSAIKNVAAGNNTSAKNTLGKTAMNASVANGASPTQASAMANAAANSPPQDAATNVLRAAQANGVNAQVAANVATAVANVANGGAGTAASANVVAENVANVTRNAARANGVNSKQANIMANAAASAVLNGVPNAAPASAMQAGQANGVNAAAAANVGGAVSNAVANASLVRNTGLQPTVYDKEVAISARQQELAPAGAAPPLTVGTYEPKPRMLIGAPTQNSRHDRASPLVANSPHPNPAALEFAIQESAKRVSVAGVIGTEFGTNINTAVQEYDAFQPSLPYVPGAMGAVDRKPGVQFQTNGTPRYDFARGNAGQANTAASSVATFTQNAAMNQGIPTAVANSMGAAAKNAVETGNGRNAGAEVLRVAAANGMSGNAVNEVANAASQAVVMTKNGAVLTDTASANGMGLGQRRA